MGELVERAMAQLAEAYERVPDVGCKGLCHDTCGPVPGGGPAERLAMRRAGYRLPTRAQALAIVAAGDADYRCTALTADNRCGAYAARPAICRVWGASEDLPCPYGCRPAAGLRLLTREETFQILAAATTAGTGREPMGEDMIREIIDGTPDLGKRFRRAGAYTPRSVPDLDA